MARLVLVVCTGMLALGGLAQLVAVAQAEDVATVELRIVEPESDSEVDLERKDDLFILNLKGTTKGFDPASMAIVLYINPHKGPTGWYVQIPPHTGVTTVAEDGAWKGTCQLGNEQWPPREEDPPVDVAAVAMTKSDAEAALEKAKRTPDKPVVELPDGLAQHKAEKLKIRLPD